MYLFLIIVGNEHILVLMWKSEDNFVELNPETFASPQFPNAMNETTIFNSNKNNNKRTCLFPRRLQVLSSRDKSLSVAGIMKIIHRPLFPSHQLLIVFVV